MIDSQLSPTCQRVSPQDVLRDRAKEALRATTFFVDLPDDLPNGDFYLGQLADAAIAAVYAALLEMELPEEAAEAGATAITSASLGMSAHRLVAREFRAVIRSLANQGGAK